MLTDVHIHKLTKDKYELRIDRFTYYITLVQLLDIYNSIVKLLDDKGDFTERPFSPTQGEKRQ